VEASNSRNPKALHGLYRDNFTFTLEEAEELKVERLRDVGNARKKEG
jgi:hypothetical protein